jgi:hypothetical protein
MRCPYLKHHVIQELVHKLSRHLYLLFELKLWLDINTLIGKCTICCNHILNGSTAPNAIDACVGISDFTPNLCVNLTTASGPTLSISLADIVLMELASAFSK